MKIEFSLNGSQHSVDVDPRENLLHLLREYIQLRGTKYGCGEGECGACTVLLNGQAVTSCMVLAGQIHGAEIVTIEGMQNDPIGQNIISAFVTQGAVQCGFCIPGMIISARALLTENNSPTINDIQFGLGGNLCRCTGYKKIIEAVLLAGEMIAAKNIHVDTNSPGYESFRSADFIHPESLEEALILLSAGDDWRVISGCTDYGVQNEHHLKAKKLLDLSGMEQVCGIGEDEKFVRIGGGTTFSDIRKSAVIEKWAKPLYQSAREVGAVQIQNRGTLAGNVVNASPAADAIPPLFVLDALVILRSVRGERAIPIQEFATGPGESVIIADEILVEVIIPKVKMDREEITFFSKFGPRNTQTISIVSVAMRGWRKNGHLTGLLIAMGAVAPTVILAEKSAQYLMSGKLTEERLITAGKLAAGVCRPIDDLRATALYRRRLVQSLLVKNLWEYTQ